MEFWETTPYSKWYTSHRRFSFTANLCIEHYEDTNEITRKIFFNLLKSLSCHSRSEEKMFQHIESLKDIFKDHSSINTNKQYTEEEKYTFCKSLLHHMREEEHAVKQSILGL